MEFLDVANEYCEQKDEIKKEDPGWDPSAVQKLPVLSAVLCHFDSKTTSTALFGSIEFQ